MEAARLLLPGDEAKLDFAKDTPNSSSSEFKEPAPLTQTIDETKLLLSECDALHCANLTYPVKSNVPGRPLECEVTPATPQALTISEKTVTTTSDDRSKQARREATRLLPPGSKANLELATDTPNSSPSKFKEPAPLT